MKNKFYLIGLLLLILSIPFQSFGQKKKKPTTQPSLSQDGFTNKNEAKNKLANGLKQGKWCEYMDEEGNVITDSTKAMSYMLTIYNTGQIYGIERGYYMTGELNWKTTYIGGKRNGFTIYYKNGKTSVEMPYVNGVQNGLKKRYREDGTLVSETSYKDGKVDGTTKRFDQTPDQASGPTKPTKFETQKWLNNKFYECIQSCDGCGHYLKLDEPFNEKSGLFGYYLYDGDENADLETVKHHSDWVGYYSIIWSFVTNFKIEGSDITIYTTRNGVHGFVFNFDKEPDLKNRIETALKALIDYNKPKGSETY